MKKVLFSIAMLLCSFTLATAQSWSQNRNNNDGYYMGPGMMWNDGYGHGYMGPGMMWGNWGNNDWHKQTQTKLGLNQNQVSQWNKVTQNSQAQQKVANDSIEYYVNQIRRLQKDKSDKVQSDLNQIKQILTPEQYTQLLQELVIQK